MQRNEGGPGETPVPEKTKRKRAFTLPNDFFFWFPVLIGAVYAAYVVFDALTRLPR